MESADTIAAIATGAGAGGVGVVRVSGRHAAVIMAGIVGGSLAPRHAAFVRFRDARGETIDEGVGLYFAAPRSYTGEDVFELQGHGGAVVLNRLLGRCLELGARLAEPGEFTRRAFLNGKLDLARAEAVADLISAQTEAAARSAARSLTGEFSRLVEEFQRELTALRTLVEASLDFPEEGTDFLDQVDLVGRTGGLVEAIDRAVLAGAAGKLLREGLAIALVGAPNVGKSSIINALCGNEVAIVTPVPGTTRDLVKESIQIDGIPIHVVDTAGLRPTTDLVEELGIARTWQAVAASDVALVVVDSTGQYEMDRELGARVSASVRKVWVHNKIDMTGETPRTQTLEGEAHVWMSAKTGAGLDLLRGAIVASERRPEGGDAPFAARARHLTALRQARTSLLAARAVMPMTEFVAEELRNAQLSLSAITGEVTADDVLGEIFSSFCIGK